MTEEAQGKSNLFNVRLVAGLIAAGVIAFAAFMLLAAYAGDFRSGRDGRPHPLSIAATGYKGLVDLIRYSGGNPRLIRSEAELDGEDLLIIAVEESTDPDRLAEMIEARGGKATLLILPKWGTVPDQARPGWVYSAGAFSPRLVARLLSKIGRYTIVQDAKTRGGASGREWMQGISVPVPRQAHFISGDGVRPLVQAPNGKVLLAQIEQRPLYILADPDLMNNHGLKNPRAAKAALDILDALNTTDAKSVSFDLTLNGFGHKPNALKLLFEPPFLALTLALFVAAILAGLHGAFRFGPERRDERSIAFGKAALVANSAALVQLVRREHRAGAAYAEAIAEEAARVSGAPANLRGDELEAYLDRLSRPGERSFSDVAARLRDAENRGGLVDAARALFRWKKELTQ